jgi:hypothetical protein
VLHGRYALVARPAHATAARPLMHRHRPAHFRLQSVNTPITMVGLPDVRDRRGAKSGPRKRR